MVLRECGCAFRSGSTIYSSWILSGFNVFYTFLPIIFYGFMEQDVKDTTALQFPQVRTCSLSLSLARSLSRALLSHPRACSLV